MVFTNSKLIREHSFDIIKSKYLKTSLFLPITVVCFATFLLSFASVTLSVSLGIVLSFWLIMRGKPDGILGLFLLYFGRYYFYDVSSFVSSGGAMPDYLRETLTVAGFPLEVQTVACGFISLRVILEIFLRPETFKSKFPKIIFPLWIVAFLPVLIGFYLGFQDKSTNWTRGLRWLMIAGSYFYGYILAKNWPKDSNNLLVIILLPLVIVMLLLMNLSVYWSHHGFLFLGLGGAFSIYFIRNRSFMFRLLGVLLLCLSVVYALKGSLTTMGIVSLSILFSYLGTKKQVAPSIIRTRIVKFAGTMAILWILIFSLGIGFLGYHPDFKPSLSYGSYEGTFAQRIEAKALSDRMPFWHPALKEILSGPSFIVPSGKALILETPGLPAEWVVGAHNVFLETLRINGLFAGTIMLAIYFLALKNNLFVLTKSADPILRSLAAGVLGVGIVGMATGDFPADMTVGFFLWSLAGLCHGLFLQRSPLAVKSKTHYIWKKKLLAPMPKQQMET